LILPSHLSPLQTYSLWLFPLFLLLSFLLCVSGPHLHSFLCPLPLFLRVTLAYETCSASYPASYATHRTTFLYDSAVWEMECHYDFLESGTASNPPPIYINLLKRWTTRRKSAHMSELNLLKKKTSLENGTFPSHVHV